MGLTIHYSFTTKLTKEEDICLLVETLPQVAQDLPFKEVDDLMEFQGQEADSDGRETEDSLRWLKIQAGRYVTEGDYHFRVEPTHIIAFTTWPGEGCEGANFGLCRYPASTELQPAAVRKKKLATHLDGWSWQSFCKTQYASSPDCGGLKNFLHCHLCVIKLLDFARSTSLMTVDVSDEGGYWEHRDAKKLASEVGDWNEMIAALAGELKDAAYAQGIHLESAIAGFQNFEHLEAKGLERLARLRGNRSQPGT